MEVKLKCEQLIDWGSTIYDQDCHVAKVSLKTDILSAFYKNNPKAKISISGTDANVRWNGVEPQNGVQNIAKKDPGRARQNS